MEALKKRNNLYRLVQHIDLKDIKSTLVVTYCGRSGSYLFSNLMDSHPEILSCPPDSLSKSLDSIAKMFRHIKKNPSSFTLEHFIEELILEHPNLFIETNRDKMQRTGEEKSAGVPKETFRGFAKALMMVHVTRYRTPLSVSDIFSLIHWAYALAAGREISMKAPIICWQRHTIVLHSDSSVYEEQLVNPIFITTIRRFEDSLDSHLSHMENLLNANGEITFASKQKLCDVLVSQFIANLIRKPAQVHHYAIKFEDMHMNTYMIMRKVCNLLDINFDPILLETTLDRDAYNFQKAPGQFVTGVNKDLKKKLTYDILDTSDVLLLNLILKRYYVHYGYEFSDAFLNKLEFNPNDEITEPIIMNLINQTSHFKESYLLEPMLTENSPINLSKVIPELPRFSQIELIN